MGIFSSKKATSVFVATQRMTEGNNFHTSLEYAMKEIIFSKGEVNDVDVITQYRNNSMPSKFKRIQKFASKQNGYVFGLPTTVKLNDSKKAVKNVMLNYLSSLEGSPVRILYAVIGDKSFVHYAWLKLVSQYGYDGKTNELMVLSTLKGSPCYLVDGTCIYSPRSWDAYEVVISNQGDMLGFNGFKDKSKVAKNVLGTADSFEFTYQYTIGSETRTEKVTVDMSDVNPPPKTETYLSKGKRETRTLYEKEGDFIQACYQINGAIKFFTYKYNSGGNQQLDNSIDFDAGLGSYFPRLYLRLSGKAIKDSQDEIRLKHTKKFCRALGLKLDDVTKRVEESIGDNLNDTRDIYITLVARPNEDKDDNIICKYLFNYFDRLYKSSKPQYGMKIKSDVNLAVVDNVSSQFILTNGIMKDVIDGVAKRTDGTPLKKGEYYITRKNAFPDIELVAVKEQFRGVYEDGIDPLKAVRVMKALKKRHFIYYQITATKCIQLLVSNLQFKVDVSGHTATVEGDSDELAIPLDISVVNDLSQKEKEYLFHKCLHIQITLLKVTEVKWYKTGIFKVVMAAVGIAIAIFTAGAGAPIGAVLTNIAISTAVGMTLSFAMSAIIKWAIKLGLDAKTAAALAIIVEVGIAAASRGTKLGSILKADDLFHQFNMVAGVYQNAVNLKVQQLQSQVQDFMNKAKDKEKELDALKSAMLTKHIPLPLQLESDRNAKKNFNVNLGETPEEFYTRTMFFDIVGVDEAFINNFAEITTILPTFKDTVSDYYNKKQEQLNTSYSSVA